MGNTSHLDAESLVESYKSGTSAYKLAKDSGCSIWSVITRLRDAGVEMRPDGTPKKLSLSPEQQKTFDSLNIGLLLGDASINGNLKTKKTRCFLRMEQSDKRLGWLEQIRDVYKGLDVHVNIIPVKPKSKPPKFEGREIVGGPSSLLYTGVSDEFRELRRKWYPEEGMKRIPRDARLDPLSVAMWLCGDGSVDGHGCLTFHTQGFLEEDVHFLSQCLLRDLNVKSSVVKHLRPGQFMLYVNGRDNSFHLKELILPHMPECCLYKLNNIRRSKVKDSAE